MKLFHFRHNYAIALTCKLSDLGGIPVLYKEDITDNFKSEFQTYHDYPGNADVIYKKCTECDEWCVIITNGKQNYFCDETLIHLRLEGLKKKLVDAETNRLLAIDFDGVKNKMEKEDVLLVEKLLKQIEELQKTASALSSENDSLKNKLVIYESNK